jgi:hypothetical protein
MKTIKRSTRKSKRSRSKVNHVPIPGHCLSRREFEVLLSMLHYSRSAGKDHTRKEETLLFTVASKEQTEAIHAICSLHTVSDAISEIEIFENLDVDEFDFNSIIREGMDARSRVNNGSIRFAKEDYDWVRMTGYNPMPTLTDFSDEMVTGSRGN